MNTDTDSRTTTIRTQDIQGVRAGVGLTPDEIFIDFPLASPRYFRVRVGDVVTEGDIQSRSSSEMDSVGVERWKVVEITPESVIAQNIESKEEVRWDRSWFEDRLARGTLSTNLTGFERITVVETESQDADDTHRGRSGGESADADQQLTVLVYSNNGKKYIQTYQIVDSGKRDTIQLTDQDETLTTLDEGQRAELDEIARRGLKQHGYVVRMQHDQSRRPGRGTPS